MNKRSNTRSRRASRRSSQRALTPKVGTAFAAHTIVSGKVFQQVSATTTAASVALHPGNVPRLTDIANAYMLYRFTELRVDVLPSYRATTSVPGSPEMYYVSYFNQVVDVLPDTTRAGSECAYSVVRPMGYVFDTANSSAISVWSTPATFDVPRSFLLGDTALKWYKANVGAPDPWDEIQGFIAYRAESSVQLHLMLYYTCEFAGPLPGISTPSDLEERLAVRNRTKYLLELLEKRSEMKLDPNAPRTFDTLVQAKHGTIPYKVGKLC